MNSQETLKILGHKSVFCQIHYTDKASVIREYVYCSTNF